MGIHCQLHCVLQDASEIGPYGMVFGGTVIGMPMLRKAKLSWLKQ